MVSVSVSRLLTVILFLFVGTAFANTNTVSSSNTVTTIDKTPPTASSPSMNTVNSDICKTGVAGAVQTQVLGISSGLTIRDSNCEMLKLSRMLYQQGLKIASVSVLCQDKRVWVAMKNAGTWCPIDGKIGEEAKELWLASPELRPDFEDLELKEPQQEFSDADQIALYKTLFLITTGLFLF